MRALTGELLLRLAASARAARARSFADLPVDSRWSDLAWRLYGRSKPAETLMLHAPGSTLASGVTSWFAQVNVPLSNPWYARLHAIPHQIRRYGALLCHPFASCSPWKYKDPRGEALVSNLSTGKHNSHQPFCSRVRLQPLGQNSLRCTKTRNWVAVQDLSDESEKLLSPPMGRSCCNSTRVKGLIEESGLLKGSNA